MLVDQHRFDRECDGHEFMLHLSLPTGVGLLNQRSHTGDGLLAADLAPLGRLGLGGDTSTLQERLD